MFRSFSNLLTSKKSSSLRRKLGAKPQVECLEERQMLTTFTEPVDGDIWIQKLPAAASYQISGQIGGQYQNPASAWAVSGDVDRYVIPVAKGTRVDVQLLSS